MPLREFGLVGLLQTSHDTLTLGVQLGGSGNDYISDPPDVRSPALFLLDQIYQAVLARGHDAEHDGDEGRCRLGDPVQSLFSARP